MWSMIEGMSRATTGHQNPLPKGSAASIRHRLRRDGTVAFDVRFRLDGSSRTAMFMDNDAAQRWATIVRRIGAAEALQLIRDQDAAAAPTLDEWAERYISGLSGVEPKTVEHYRTFMRLSISPTLGSLPVDAIAPARIANWVNELATRYAAKTIKNRHGFLFAVFQSAVEDGLIARNPCGRIRLPASEASEKVFLTIPEYDHLLAFIPERHRTMVELIAQTGMRWGEASALRWSDFDLRSEIDSETGETLRAGLVRVSRAWKYSREQGWYIGAPKTKMSRRTISLPSNLIPALEPLVRAHRDWLFANADGSPVRHAKFMSNVWYPATRLANGEAAFPDRTPAPGGTWDVPPATEPLGKWPGVHSLRHSHALWLIGAGVSMAVVQARLGHESIQTTIATYTHLTPDVLAQPAAAMDRLRGLDP